MDTVVRQFGSALGELLKASDYAAELGRDPWDFALELPTLLTFGLTTTEIRRWIVLGYIECAQETTGMADTRRRFAPSPALLLTERTAVILTDLGRSAARDLLAQSGPLAPRAGSQSTPLAPRAGLLSPILTKNLLPSLDHSADCPQTAPSSARHPTTLAVAESALVIGIPTTSPLYVPGAAPAGPTPAPTAVPHWDADRRELTFRGQLVKRFRVPAPNQIAILEAFQEEGWPPRIDDPLPPAAEIDPKPG